MSRSQLKKKPVTEESKGSFLCKHIWGLDWTEQFPRKLTDTIRIEYLSFEEAGPLLKSLLPEVYKTEPGSARFGEEDPKQFKPKYFEAVGDFFAFYDEAKQDTLVAMAIGTIMDWSGYNFRNIAVAPAYQDRGIYPQFFELLGVILREHGVSRIEGDVAPTNRHHIHALNKMGCIATSMTYGERWGVLLHMTRYLNESDEERVSQLFSTTHKSDSSSNQKQKTKA